MKKEFASLLWNPSSELEVMLMYINMMEATAGILVVLNINKLVRCNTRPIYTSIYPYETLHNAHQSMNKL